MNDYAEAIGSLRPKKTEGLAFKVTQRVEEVEG